MGSSAVRAIDHVQLAMPAGAEDELRGFYVGVLGLTEVPKPAELASRGGAWFEDGPIKVHLGVDPDFRPAKKAHVAFLVDDVAALLARCRAAGLDIEGGTPVDGVVRGFVFDPVGNRIELTQPKVTSS